MALERAWTEVILDQPGGAYQQSIGTLMVAIWCYHNYRWILRVFQHRAHILCSQERQIRRDNQHTTGDVLFRHNRSPRQGNIELRRAMFQYRTSTVIPC